MKRTHPFHRGTRIATFVPFAVALMATGAACGGGIEVRSDYAPGTDFSRYSTFYVNGQAPGDNTLTDFWEARVDNAIASYLESKGMTRADSRSGADVAIGYQLTTEERSSFQTVSTGWGGYGYGGYGGWYGPGWGGGMSTTSTREYRYQVGQLVVAFFDTQANEMVYVSTGSGTLEQRDRSPEEAQQMAHDVIREILRDYPPQSN